MEQLQSELGVDDAQRTPLANESLREFYARTQATWSAEAVQSLGPDEPVDEKVLRRRGFALAERRYQVNPSVDGMSEDDMNAKYCCCVVGTVADIAAIK